MTISSISGELTYNTALTGDGVLLIGYGLRLYYNLDYLVHLLDVGHLIGEIAGEEIQSKPLRLGKSVITPQDLKEAIISHLSSMNIILV